MESKGGKERGKDYNHSTFVDLVINGLLGEISVGDCCVLSVVCCVMLCVCGIEALHLALPLPLLCF